MRVHKVKDCCCGCSLEMGTKIIAWLQIICGVIMMAKFTLTMAALDYVNQTTDLLTKDLFTNLAKADHSSADTTYNGNIGSFGNMGFTVYKDGTINIPKPSPFIFIGYIVCGFLVTILGVILIIAAMNSRPHLLRIWIVISLISLILYVVSATIQVVLVVNAGLSIAVTYILMTLLIGLILNYYCIVVVASFREQIMSGNNPAY